MLIGMMSICYYKVLISSIYERKYEGAKILEINEIYVKSNCFLFYFIALVKKIICTKEIRCREIHTLCFARNNLNSNG